MHKGYKVEMEVPVPIIFEKVKLDIDALAPVHTAQVLTHVKFAGKKVGLLINFNVTVLKQGIKRYIL